MNQETKTPIDTEEWLAFWHDYYAKNPQKKHEEQRRLKAMLSGDWSEEEETEFKRLAKTGVFMYCQDFIAWKNKTFTAEEEKKIERLNPHSWKAANDCYEMINSIDDPDAAKELLVKASAILANSILGKTPWCGK